MWSYQWLAVLFCLWGCLCLGAAADSITSQQQASPSIYTNEHAVLSDMSTIPSLAEVSNVDCPNMKLITSSSLSSSEATTFSFVSRVDRSLKQVFLRYLDDVAYPNSAVGTSAPVYNRTRCLQCLSLSTKCGYCQSFDVCYYLSEPQACADNRNLQYSPSYNARSCDNVFLVEEASDKHGLSLFMMLLVAGIVVGGCVLATAIAVAIWQLTRWRKNRTKIITIQPGQSSKKLKKTLSLNAVEAQQDYTPPQDLDREEEEDDEHSESLRYGNDVFVQKVQSKDLQVYDDYDHHHKQQKTRHFHSSSGSNKHVHPTAYNSAHDEEDAYLHQEVPIYKTPSKRSGSFMIHRDPSLQNDADSDEDDGIQFPFSEKKKRRPSQATVATNNAQMNVGVSRSSFVSISSPGGGGGGLRSSFASPYNGSGSQKYANNTTTSSKGSHKLVSIPYSTNSTPSPHSEDHDFF